MWILTMDVMNYMRTSVQNVDRFCGIFFIGRVFRPQNHDKCKFGPFLGPNDPLHQQDLCKNKPSLDGFTTEVGWGIEFLIVAINLLFLRMENGSMPCLIIFGIPVVCLKPFLFLNQLQSWETFSKRIISITTIWDCQLSQLEHNLVKFLRFL